jgi:hypothetical protein
MNVKILDMIGAGAEFRLLIGLIKPGQRKWGTLVGKRLALNCGKRQALFPLARACGERE